MLDVFFRSTNFTELKPCFTAKELRISSKFFGSLDTMMSMSNYNRFAEFNSNIKAVPPLKMKGNSEFANPSKSSKARITFSTRILSALRFDLETVSIHCCVNVSCCIILHYKTAVNFLFCRNLETLFR